MSPIAFGGDWDECHHDHYTAPAPHTDPPPVHSAVEIDWDGSRAGGILARLNPAVEAARRAREREALCPSWMAL